MRSRAASWMLTSTWADAGLMSPTVSDENDHEDAGIEWWMDSSCGIGDIAYCVLVVGFGFGSIAHVPA